MKYSKITFLDKKVLLGLETMSYTVVVLQEAPEEGWGNVWRDIEEPLVDQQSDVLVTVLEQLRELRVL